MEKYLNDAIDDHGAACICYVLIWSRIWILIGDTGWEIFSLILVRSNNRKCANDVMKLEGP